ncbi:MAG: hypothetical protein ABIA37_01375, partial [Candidatus Woesearchaeota archaeon]
MPYRTKGCPDLYNEGIKFLDNLLYEESSSLAWPIDKVVMGLARSILLIDPSPCYILNKENKVALGVLIRHNLANYLTSEFKRLMTKTDAIYHAHHDSLLYQMIKKRNVAEESIEGLTEEFIWGRKAYELKELIDSPDQERYWQA